MRFRSMRVARGAVAVASAMAIGLVLPGSDGSGPVTLGQVQAAGADVEGALPITCSVSAVACQVAVEVLRDFPYPWVVLDYRVEIHPRDGRWLAGRTDDAGVIVLYVDDGPNRRRIRSTFAHELGHALHQPCGEEVLEEWRERRGLSPDAPMHVEPPHDYDSVAEDFAEGLRQYLGMGASRSPLGRPLTQTWLQRNADLFVPSGCP